MRLDLHLARFPDIGTRSAAQKLIHRGSVQVNGIVVLRPAHQVGSSDVVTWTLHRLAPASHVPQGPVLEILHEDTACIVVNKPAGCSVHPGAGMACDTPTILDAAHHLFAMRGLAFEPASVLVHRLDKNTTGCLLLALSPTAHRALQRQFADRTVSKTYLAAVAGCPQPPAAVIDAPIGRHVVDRRRMSIHRLSSSRESRTTYRTIRTSSDASLLACDLHTGRTHQIRVHLSSIGHPVLGDDTYATLESRRTSEKYGHPGMCLHAWVLRFHSPVSGMVEVTAPPATSIQQVCERAGWSLPTPSEIKERV